MFSSKTWAGETQCQLFELEGHTLGCQKGKEGTVLEAKAFLRLSRFDDNLPPRSVTITVTAGPEIDEGEARILEDDVNDQLIEILKRLGVTSSASSAFERTR